MTAVTTGRRRIGPLQRLAITSTWVCIAALCALSGVGAGLGLNAIATAVN
jgi:hypothetical protein